MKNDKEQHEHRHPGSVVAEDDALTLWLNKLWANTEPPERLELRQMFGKSKAIRGEMIFHEDFPPGKKLDIEQANKLANEIIAAAQNDCDSTEKKASYELSIIDRNRKVDPLIRRIGPLQPKRSYAMAKNSSEFLEEEGEDDLNSQGLSLRYTKENFAQNQWDKQRVDRVTDGMFMLLYNLVQRLEQHNEKLMGQNIMMFDKCQESQDRSLDRELIRDKEKLKMSLWKDGLRTARNLLPGLFKNGEETAASAQQALSSPSTSTDSTPSVKTFSTSPERALVDNFLHDCEEAKIDVALFGDFEERDGKIALTKPGIFTLKQFAILCGVRTGQLPPHALDELMPKSGHQNAITEEQIQKAMDAGVTDGIGMALMELVGLRQRAQEAIASTAASKPHNEVQGDQEHV